LRRFANRLILAALAIVGGYFAASALAEWQRGKASPRAATPVASTPATAGSWTDGNALVGRVLATLERRPNIAARFRQSLRIGEEQLAGDGEYWQQGVGNTRRTCWQWKTLLGDEAATFSQIYDREGCLWTDVRLPERTVTCVDVKDVRRALGMAGANGQGRAGGGVQQLELLARGGLSQLVAELQRSFDFGPSAETTVDGHAALAVLGQWRREALARDWPALAPTATADWPAHVPHHVVVVVGAVDFFPYVVEYRRASEAALAEAAPSETAADPLGQYAFYAVDYATPMREERFTFPANDVDWRDVTGAVIERLRPAAEQTAAAESGVVRE
jgi:hypothetical protein